MDLTLLTHKIRYIAHGLFFLAGIFFSSSNGYAAVDDPIQFDDQPLKEAISTPDWFKVSFLELQDDLTEAILNNKKGLMIYFGQKTCPYCKAQLERNWGQKDILNYTLQNFDVIGINVRGHRQVIDFDGTEYTEKEFSVKHNTNFTPSLIFYNTKGKPVLRLRGYRPPYQFRAALEYVADKHYLTESLGDYIARAETAFSFGKDDLNIHDSFLPPPYNLDRSRIHGQQPLLVTFERKRCHACDVLHGGPLQDQRIIKKLEQTDAGQLYMTSNTPVITPDGRRTTAKQWAKDLNLDYAPTLVFFDEQGKEIIRIDSVVWFYRLNNVMNYVITKGYLEHSTFQLWRQRKRR